MMSYIKWLFFCLLAVFYAYNYFSEVEYRIVKTKVVRAYCQPTLKSGTLLKLRYESEGQISGLSLFPLKIPCETLLEEIEKKQVISVKEARVGLGVWIWDYTGIQVSIDDGKTFYGQ
ncbi:hypothetical protein RDG65_003101 [Vibrio fluvialis]|nr:hypothetical protein [Vibrio fluvialis]ELE5027793.1 hypothetical protein [Vibrio fluvialis]MCE7628080.1 hypothetical protein [Vibrio fluvialis]